MNAAFSQALALAKPFTKFDAALDIQYSQEASKVLGKDYWTVLTAFKFYVGDLADNCWVYVPAGYLTDGASVPRPFWSIIPPWGPYGQAAVVHDYLCGTLELNRQGVSVAIDRAKCDSVFKEAMKAAGVSVWKRNLMYIAVRTYSVLARIHKPTVNKEKTTLEANWAAEHSTTPPALVAVDSAATPSPHADAAPTASV